MEQRDASPMRKDPRRKKLTTASLRTAITDDSFDKRVIYARPLLEHTALSEMEASQEQTRVRVRYTREFMVALKDEHKTLVGGVEKLGCVSVVSCLRSLGILG